MEVFRSFEVSVLNVYLDDNRDSEGTVLITVNEIHSGTVVVTSSYVS